ncbi:MAG TPA: molybdopterin-dependent oxidoreductase, partial [Dehalococcoidia bacterium]|nr:molybdopterin-dependent oxidoreductase [Dehalococcoidia bacterium]
MSHLSRRDFLKLSASALAAVGAASVLDLAYLEEATNIPNPLDSYPDRDWEKVYLDQYRYDSSFTFICAPNDTHACRLRAFVRNDVVIRTEQNYDVGTYGDLDGNRPSFRWSPRGCAKGYSVPRRLYGPHRAKYPMIRKGWRQWADDGFPSLSDTPALRTKYKFDSRGTDSFERMSWDDVNRYVARGLIAIAGTYSGEDGRRRLIEKDGYEPEMLEHWEGAGTRLMKMGSSLPVHGMVGKLGIFRFANMLALLDAQVRGVSAEEAKGGSGWSEYTWRGDQAPGMPFVHGLQTSDVDFNDLALSQLHIQVGKNLVENKMPESHWFHDLIENGGTIVVISPEYSPPASKADYWIPVRAGLTDTALFLGITREIIENGSYDAEFVRNFTDFPYLVRLDNLRRLRADEVFPNYAKRLKEDGPSFTLQGLTQDQYDKLGDFVVWDEAKGAPGPVARDDIGARMATSGVKPAVEGHFQVTLADGSRVEVATVFQMYREHLKDYDLDTVEEISGAPKDLVARLAQDIATKGPVAIHMGEGINHYFHATLANRAMYLPLMLTGNIGKPGAGCHTWAGNYKGGIFQGAPWHGPGAAVYRWENPFDPVLDEDGTVTKEHIEEYTYEDEPGWWNMGERPLIVDTPSAGRKVFTGKTHMPRPTKMMWYNNSNLLNVAKWHYDMIKNVNPKVDMIIDQQVEWTGSAEYADLILPANSWIEFQDKEMCGSCSNPFLQIWGGGGIDPLHDTRDDPAIFAGVAEALATELEDRKFKDYWKFVLDGRSSVYLQRILDASVTTSGYTVKDIVDGKYGEPGAALMLYRTYPRIPFYEQVNDSLPFYTDTGRLNAYCDLPEAIEYGENLVVHREAVEATPYLPNVIVSTSPYLRPQDYGISRSETDANMRSVRNLMLPWSEVKKTTNPLFEQG